MRAFKPQLEQLEHRHLLAAALVNHGVPAIANVQIEAIFYGNYWTTTQGIARRVALQTAMQTLIGGTYMDGLKSLGIARGGIETIDVVPGNVTGGLVTGLEPIIQREIGNRHLPAPTSQRLYMFFGPSGADLDGDESHSFFSLGGKNVIYGQVPFNFDSQLNNSFASQTWGFTHEIVEAVTDPYWSDNDTRGGWWFDNWTDPSYNELCDVAETVHGDSEVTYGGYVVSPYWEAPSPLLKKPGDTGGNQAPAITSPNNATFRAGMTTNFTFTVTGFPTPAIDEAGNLPAGLTFTDNGNGTATLSGIPAAGTGGVYPISLTASNGIGTDAQQAFTLKVNQPPSITSLNHTTFAVGTAGSFTMTANGFPAPTFTIVSGALPAGVKLSASGVLSGTPAAGTGKNYSILVAASNGIPVNGTTPRALQVFTLTVTQPLAITSASSALFRVGLPGSFRVTATGFPTAILGEEGALPAGVSFNKTTGVLSGIPAAGTGRNYSIAFTAMNSAGDSTAKAFTLVVMQAPVITSARSATFLAGVMTIVPQSFTVTATGFPAPKFSAAGLLPAGVSFVNGVLSGNPVKAGTYHLVIKASNGFKNALGQAVDAVQSFTLVVSQPKKPALVPAVSLASDPVLELLAFSLAQKKPS